jgi:hypothetical protein
MALQHFVVAVIGKFARHAPGELLHVHIDAAAGLALEPVNLFGEVHLAQDRADFLVPVGREELGGIADRHPLDRNERVGKQDTAHVNDAVDADLRAPTDARAVEDPDARREETFVLDDTALERRMRPDQHVVADLHSVSARASDVEVLADDTLCADPHRRAVRLDHRAPGDVRSRADCHVAANYRCRRNICGRVDGGSFALMFNQHERRFDLK